MANSKQKLDQVYSRGDYESDFEYETEASCKRIKRNEDDLRLKSKPKHIPRPEKQDFAQECSKEQGLIRRQQLLALDAYSRHKEIINQYVLNVKGSTSYLKRNRCNEKRDSDIIVANHHFIWEDDEEASTWEKQLAKKYYEKLFKEYCLADLSRYKENKIAMRWRTEQEVIIGKGQFSCGNIKCDIREDVKCWEVNFGYVEHGQKKNALVKLRLCPSCSYKLNYHHKKKEIIKSKTTNVLVDNISPHETEESNVDESLHNASVHSTNDENISKDSSTSAGIWKKPIEEEVERNEDRTDEFEQYLADMFL